MYTVVKVHSIRAYRHCLGLTLQLYHTYLTPEPLGGVRNLLVTDPTTSTLNVQWQPAEGTVRHYKVFYVPVDGGQEERVSWKIVLEQ